MNLLQQAKNRLPKQNQPNIPELLEGILQQLTEINNKLSAPQQAELESGSENADDTPTTEEKKEEQQPKGRKGRRQSAPPTTVPHNEVEEV